MNAFFSRNYNELKTYSDKIAGQDGGDLLHTCITQWYDSPAVLNEHATKGDEFLLFYFRAGLRMSYYSKTSKFHYTHKHRVNPKHVNSQLPDLVTHSEPEIWLFDILERIKGLHWFHRNIFTLYLDGANLKTLSEESEIPYRTLLRSVEKTRKYLEDE